MPRVVLATRIARRTLDVLLVALIATVVATLLLAKVVPSVTGGATFVVGGGSMEPAIPLGAALVATPVSPDELAVGDAVSLKVGTQESVFTHRIVRLVPRDDGLWLATRGDANAEDDPSIVPASAVIGRVSLVMPWVGYLVTLLGSIQGVAFAVSLAGFLLAGAWLLETLEDDQRDALRRRAQAGLASLAADGPAESRVPG